MARPGRQGTKKIDTITIKGDFTTVEVDLRYHKENGTFYASIGTVDFHDDDLASLKEKLVEHLKKQEVLTWEKYILVEYSSTELATVLGGTRGSYYGASDKAKKAGNVGGIAIEYQVFEVSNSFDMSIGDKKSTARRWREYRRREIYGEWIQHGGTGNEDQHVEDHYKYRFDRLIPYSDERIAALDRIQAAIVDLDKKMTTLFGKGASSAIMAATLDQLDASKLLGGG